MIEVATAEIPLTRLGQDTSLILVEAAEEHCWMRVANIDEQDISIFIFFKRIAPLISVEGRDCTGFTHQVHVFRLQSGNLHRIFYTLFLTLGQVDWKRYGEEAVTDINIISALLQTFAQNSSNDLLSMQVLLIWHLNHPAPRVVSVEDVLLFKLLYLLLRRAKQTCWIEEGTIRLESNLVRCNASN